MEKLVQVRCAECGSANVEHAHWVDLNTDEVVSLFGSWCEPDSSWCRELARRALAERASEEGMAA